MCEELLHAEEQLKREIRDIRRQKIKQKTCRTIVTILDALTDKIPMPTRISYNSRDGWIFEF